MDRPSQNGKVLKKQVHLSRWTTLLGWTGPGVDKTWTPLWTPFWTPHFLVKIIKDQRFERRR